MLKQRPIMVVALLSIAVVLVISVPSFTPCADAVQPSSVASYTTTVTGDQGQVRTQARWFTDPSSSWPLELASATSTLDLLHQQIFRVYPSVESFDVLLSYRLTDMFLLTSSGRLLFNQHQFRLTSKVARFGVDFESPWPFLDRSLQPISTAELLLRGDHTWSTDFSIRAGLRWDRSREMPNSLSLMLECFQGESRSKQGYQQKIDYIGLAFHYGF